jgi:hypothetical protein
VTCDLLARFRFELISMLLQQWAERVPRPPASRGQEYLVRVSEIGTCVLDEATERLEDVACLAQHLTNTWIQRQPAKVRTPGHAFAADRDLSR